MQVKQHFIIFEKIARSEKCAPSAVSFLCVNRKFIYFLVGVGKYRIQITLRKNRKGNRLIEIRSLIETKISG